MDPIAEQLTARLRNDPTDGAAYEELRAHYRREGDLASLANLLEGWASTNAHDWENASQAYAEAADAVLSATHDRARAKTLYREALQLNVLHPEAGTQLLALLEQEPEHAELVEFLDAYARALEPAGAAPAYVAGLLRRLGELWEHELARPDVAADCYQRAEQLERAAPEDGAAHPPSLSHDDARALADGYEQEALHEQDPARKAALLSQLAELRAGQLDELEGAIVALRQALAGVPGDVAVMHQLATCLLARAQIAEPLAAQTDHRRVAELFYQIAQGVDEGEALPYLESALASMPDHDGALALLERLAAAQGRAEILPAYWVGFVAAAGDGPEADQRRLLLAQAYLASDQLDDAIFCLQAAAEHGNARAHELLQAAYARQGHSAKPAAGPRDGAGEAADPNRLPSQKAAPRPEDDERARIALKIAELRKQVQEALSAREHDRAAEHCRAILELDAGDLEAFNVLESHYRKRRDYTNLRDLLLASTRISGLSVDARKMRLREVASLSEAKLRDPEGATSAWRGVVTLDPADREALASLKRLLKKAQQWDELASVLEREALATTALEEKAALIREIALLHRDKRKDPVETAEALRQLHALKPDDAAVRDELCELLIEVEQWVDAVPLLRERIDASSDELDKQKLSGVLAAVLHERLDDLEAAYEVCEQILKGKPNDRSAFDRMERIDQQAGNYARLLSTLERRALLAAKSERPALFTRMGVIAEEKLHDIDKAAEYFGDALDLAPDREDALSRLVELFERASRYEQLVELLRERTLLEKDPRNRAPFYRRIAQILAERLHDEPGAADAYRRLLELEDHEEALRFLRGVALRNDDPEELADVLRRLGARVEDARERRDFLFDLALILHERLSRTPEASTVLKRIVEQVDPTFEPAIEILAQISETSSDHAGLALALERRLALAGSASLRLPIAKRLADLYERELKDGARAIPALLAWARDEPQSPEPQRRLRTLLEQRKQWPELLATLDALAEWENDFDARDDATIAAAHVAFEQLKDPEGAWRRLLPLVEERNEQADKALREIARSAGMEREQAALYVRLAQETEDPTLQAIHWGGAAELFEHALDDPAQALEASLRRLATDLSNRDFLAAVDRLACATKAFRRLAQVYDRLLKQAEDDADKVALLRRHAALLIDEQPDEALDRIVRACALAPHDEALLASAEELAERTRRSEELLVVYDRRRARSDDDRDKLRLILRAARLCDGALRDRERASQYLKNALLVANGSPELGVEVEAVARDLDAARPELGADNARRALIRAHREVAERAEPATAVRLMLRATELLWGELDDERGAFDMLRQALLLLPKSDEVYSALLALAEKHARLDSLDAHLSRLIDDAIDPTTAVVLLRRRGALLEGPLNRFQDAAAVYTKLLQLRPDDTQAADKLRKSLRQSGRHQDLLLALNKQLQRTRDLETRVATLKEIALTWENDLKNRWEALDAWKAVLREGPQDPAALAAVQRLERGRASTSGASDDDDATNAEATLDARASGLVNEVVDATRSSDAARAKAEGASSPEAHGQERPAMLAAEQRAASAAYPGPEPNVREADDAPEAPGEEPQGVATSRAPQPQARPGVPSSASAEPEAATPSAVSAPVDEDDASATPASTEPEADLDALDAAMSAGRGRVEELDVLDAAPAIAVEVAIDRTARPRASSVPLPPPPSLPTPAQLSSPPPRAAHATGAVSEARPSVPSLPHAPRRAPPPPPPPPQVPRRSAAPSLPSQQPPTIEATPPLAPRPGSKPPPLPSARPSSQPPPLPSARTGSQPPPLPSQRKQQ